MLIERLNTKRIRLFPFISIRFLSHPSFVVSVSVALRLHLAAISIEFIEIGSIASRFFSLRPFEERKINNTECRHQLIFGIFEYLQVAAPLEVIETNLWGYSRLISNEFGTNRHRSRGVGRHNMSLSTGRENVSIDYLGNALLIVSQGGHHLQCCCRRENKDQTHPFS